MRQATRRALCAIAISVMGICATEAQSINITFRDNEGILQRHAISNDAIIKTWRPDGSNEAGIEYQNGALLGTTTKRLDGSLETGVVYQNGALFGTSTYRPDGIIETVVYYIGGALALMSTSRPDGSPGARIEYENGEAVCVNP